MANYDSYISIWWDEIIKILILQEMMHLIMIFLLNLHMIIYLNIII
jgi:hypothetical protein